MKVLIQSLVLITVDPFGDVVIPLRFPLITSEQCPFFIVATCCIVAIAVPWSYLVAVKLVEYPGGLMYKNQWQEAFKGTKYANYLLASAISCFLHPSCPPGDTSHSIILIKLKSQAR